MNHSTANGFLLCVDANYSGTDATVAGVYFQDWEDSTALGELNIHTAVPAEYESGAFYKRELPCILELLSKLPQLPTLIIIDGYVWLGRDRPGLGHHLFIALGGQTPVVGVAKNPFASNDLAISVLRGSSKRPLYVTADGIDPDEAAAAVKTMHGSFRVPDLIKRADQLCRPAKHTLP